MDTSDYIVSWKSVAGTKRKNVSPEKKKWLIFIVLKE